MNTQANPWFQDALFYHIYPLGFCGAPERNDFASPPQERLQKVSQWIPHMRELGANALYLGPLFESSAHGYDTADYLRVDRRLGSNAGLQQLSADLHRSGIRLILDGVFNHVGRDFWAFRDVQAHGAGSPYCGWFDGLRFDGTSPYGDPFTYTPWEGHYDLVRLNLTNPDVRAHLFEAVRTWVQEFDIDGLRLDVAYLLDLDFLQALSAFCRTLKPDFFLLGEVVHGDYSRWANPHTLDSVTNYEAYKGLYSSLVDRNYFEIAYSLNREFGPNGLYKGLPLYNFVDNHDVDRVAAKLPDPALLYPLYLLLFSMPGMPSIYYGSEFGLDGRRTAQDDRALRPSLELEALQRSAPQPDLPATIARLAALRAELPALRSGGYSQLHVASEQLAFARFTSDEYVVVLLNAAAEPARLELDLPVRASQAFDLLNNDENFDLENGKLVVESIPPRWGRVLKLNVS
ncbi:MAG: cyclomaltodextrinase / maltogenic alpha-amylase / neopullulanase [Chloroflexota bacterium]|nr:cyclomaltodextrinase / maltogenic alpha-amylase / neopullulanase [Chloroflexota bacterium]